MSDFKEMTYEQKIGKAFFDLSQEIANTEIKKLRRQVKKLKAENLVLKKANDANTSDNNCNIPPVSFSEERAEVREYAQWKSCKHKGCSRSVAGVDYCFEHERT